MESPKMFTTLTGKNPDDDGGSVVCKGESFGVGGVAEELGNGVCGVSSGVSVEGKVEEIVGVVEEGNLTRSDEIGNECIEFGSEESGLESAVGEMKEDAVVADGLEGLEDAPVHQLEVGGNVNKEFGVVEIPVAKLIDEEELLLSKKQKVVQEVGSFTVGDIVWCMAKNNIWWPALICDPLDARKQTTKTWDSEKHLIRHFGSKALVWSPSTHLKHFLKCFKEMSSQGKSKSFLGAIEKAVEEVGRRLKLEMSCSCISKEIRVRLIGRNKEEFKPWYTSDDIVAHRFDPTSFLVRVKNLARMGNLLDIVELVATRSNISAYYAYFGHSQLYMRHLCDSDGLNGGVTSLTAEEGTEGGDHLVIQKDSQFLEASLMEESPKLSAEGTAEKGFESRERKKSKYLSFPFVDPSDTKSFRDPIDSSEASGKHSSSSGKRLLGKSIRKFSTIPSFGVLKDLKVSPTQLLTELCDTSRGCFYLNGNTILNSTFEFFSEFRRYTFKDSDIASNLCNEDGIVDKDGLEVHDATPLSEIKPAKKHKNSVIHKLETSDNEPTLGQLKDTILKECQGAPSAKALSKSRKRKETSIANHQGDNTISVLDLNLNGGFPRPQYNSLDKDIVGESNSQTKKRKNEIATTTSGHELENGTIKAKPFSLVVDLFIDSHSLAGLLEANVEKHFGGTPTTLNTTTAPIPSLAKNMNHTEAELVKVPACVELLPISFKSDKKMENPSATLTGLGLPDLNGNILEPNSSATSPKLSIHAKMNPTSHPAARIEELSIPVIESQLEKMTKALQESGSNISPDMRAMLENDIQCLLKKVKDMKGSPS